MAIIQAKTLEAKSDQMNAIDLAKETTFRISEIKYNPEAREQNVWVYFENHGSRPWKPSKGMQRLLCKAWSMDTDNWVGNLITLFNDTEVTWAGKKVGGLRVLAMSGIGNKPMEFLNVISRQKREIETVNPLSYDQPVANEFIFNHWEERINSSVDSDALDIVLKELKSSGFKSDDVKSMTNCVKAKKEDLASVDSDEA